MKNLLLTGRPGIGKTTLIVRLAQMLQDRRLAGFYTEEIRQGPARAGFRVATLSGQTATLAHRNIKSLQRVGQYFVDVSAFDQLVLPELARPCKLILIDEIGKMECFSSRFVECVRELLGGTTSLIATVALKGTGLIAEVKSRSDVEVVEVTRENRDELPRLLAKQTGG